MAILAAITVVTLLPGQRFAVANGNLDVFLNTLTGVAAAGAAALAWLRYRIDDDVSAIYESAAFLVLFATRLLIVGIAAFGRSDSFGMALESPQQWPLYAWSLARLTSALLLLLAAAASLRRARTIRAPAVLVEFGPLVVLLICFVALIMLEPQLPMLLGPEGFAALRGDRAAAAGMEPLGWAIEATIAVAYLVAAARYYRVAEERGRAYATYLTIALIVAGFSQIHWSLFPGIYRPLVTVDDLLRAVFSVILLLGIGAQFNGDLRALRSANARLRALRTADAERVVLEAQARLAREIHDGLSQDLWLAKLKAARLATIVTDPPEARELVTEFSDAVGRALDNARTVVETLRMGSSGRGLDESIRRAVTQFEADSGIRAEISRLEGIPNLEPDSQEELLRIMREALVNVEKHADATVVRVTAASTDDGATFELRVADNGRGFDPGDLGASAFGLRGMRERAELLGGFVEVVSKPADGTTVTIRLPRSPMAPLAREP